MKQKINGKRLWDSIMEMATIGPGDHGGSRRLALTDEDVQGRKRFMQWCEAAGCQITIDDMGNMFARRAGKNPDLPPVCAGSHLDTQPHGGRFDGIFGVLAALEVVRTLNDYDIQTDAPVEIINWTNEEGSRFAPAMLASGVFAGLFAKEYAWARQDADGKTIRQELERTGFFGKQPCGEHVMTAFIEAHIEQGPILEASGNPIGVVVGGQGTRWFDVRVRGQDSHAGSTPMRGRRDALVAAAELVQCVRNIALEFKPDGVGTVGQLEVLPNSRNTIAGEVFFTIDIRNPNAQALARMDQRLREESARISESSNMEIDIEEIWHNPPVSFDERCVEAVRNAAQAMALEHEDIVSGAGHDACQVCRVVPTAMIFIPCAGGLSHNEAEHATPEDIEAGGNVLLHTILSLASNANNGGSAIAADH